MKAPSKILGRLLAVLADDEHQRKELEMLMRTDSSLSANVLKVANSAQFRGGNVVDIGAAMTRLGENEISRIAIRASAACMKVESVDGYGMHGGGLWANGMYSAVAAELLSKRCKKVDGGVAYTAGLLVDVGKRVLGPELENYMDEAFAANPGHSFVDVELALLGCSHADIGAALAAKWGLPESLQNAIRWHHQPLQADADQPLVWVCHVADFLAMNLGGGGSAEGLAYKLEDGWREYIDISKQELVSLLPEVQSIASEVLDEIAA
ncbi:MAG: HDOD domain-containing protein [Kofleriaceae bacterium]|nr:HDOD domain-containing protein [Kofleriaceae bacterium]